MDRKELKNEAKKVLKRNYLKCIIITFFVGLIINSGYQYTTKNNKIDIKQNNPIHTEKKSNYKIIEETLDLATKRSKEQIEKDKKARGVVAPIVNKVTESKSSLVCILSFINLFFFKHKTGPAMLSLIACIILMINYIFIQNLISIGSNRFYLENRRYNNTKLDKVLYPYKKKRISHLAYIMFLKDLYINLWALTIVGAFIKYYEYVMIPYILAENPNISKKDAFKISKDLTKGHKWELFKLDLSFFGWFLLAVITVGISNILFFNSYRDCILAEVYMKLRNEKHNKWKDFLNDEKLNIKEVVDDIYPEESVKKKKEPKRDYNKSYNVTSYILFFFTFSFIGWLWEVLLHIIMDGTFVNRGFMYGPWLPIYGFGGVFILLLLKSFRNKQLVFFIACIVLAGIIEYSTSWYLETFKGMKWWDYTGYYLNLNGRICLEGLIVFGLGGCALTYIIAPVLDDLYELIKPKLKIIICVILLLCYGTDLVYSNGHPNSGKGITDYQS